MQRIFEDLEERERVAERASERQRASVLDSQEGQSTSAGLVSRAGSDRLCRTISGWTVPGHGVSSHPLDQEPSENGLLKPTSWVFTALELTSESGCPLVTGDAPVTALGLCVTSMLGG